MPTTTLLGEYQLLAWCLASTINWMNRNQTKWTWEKKTLSALYAESKRMRKKYIDCRRVSKAQIEKKLHDKLHSPLNRNQLMFCAFDVHFIMPSPNWFITLDTVSHYQYRRRLNGSKVDAPAFCKCMRAILTTHNQWMVGNKIFTHYLDATHTT